MRRVEFSPIVKSKIEELKDNLLSEYGEEIAKKVLAGMLEDTDRLSVFAESGTNISQAYNLETEYWYLFTHHHYMVYRIDPESVVIVQMFHEREDFMMKLFGISGRSQESINY